MMDDGQLLGQYVRERSEAAFGELVSHHIDLVYSAALRVVGGDCHLAEDVTQMVFADLARKASSLPANMLLPGWLYRHTCFTAANTVRTLRRRQQREQTAMEMKALDESAKLPWEDIAPHLDDGLNQLNTDDRDALVLRFLKRQDFRAVGAALGISEDAAQKRVTRALDKLREVLRQRGVALSAAALASVMTAETVTAAPAGLAVAVTTASLASGATGTGIVLTTAKVMAMTKLKIGIVGALVVAGLATPLALQHQELKKSRDDNERMRAENATLRQQHEEQLAKLQAENKRLAGLAASATTPNAAQQAQFNELLRLRGEVTGLKASAASNTNTVAEALKGPEMKDAVKAVLRNNMEKSFGPLFASLHLNPEQTTALKDLILKKLTAGMDNSLAVFAGDTDPSKRFELLAQVKAEKGAVDEEIRQLLGDENYTQFQAFEKTQVDRLAINDFKNQLGGASALNGDQERQLIQATSEERQQFKFTTDYTETSSITMDAASYYFEARLKQHQQEQEEFDRLCIARAQGILTPGQLEAYQEFLAKQSETQAAMLQFSAKFFAPKAPAK